MKLVGPAIAVLGFMAIAAPATAEDWYTLDSQTEQITFSMVEQRPGGARIWLRFLRVAEIEGAEVRFLLDVTCDPPTAVGVEVRRLDATGREQSATLDNEPMDEDFVQPLSIAACNYLPATSAARRAEASATSNRLTTMLRSEDAYEQARGIDIVLSEPGAFHPMIFVSLANALYAQERHAEAIEWFTFGHVRLITDMRAASIANPMAYEGAFGLIYPMYPFSASRELSIALDAVTDAERTATLHRAFALDADIPRFYPLDNFFGLDDICWGSPDAPRPGSDFLIRARVEEARRALSTNAQPN